MELGNPVVQFSRTEKKEKKTLEKGQSGKGGSLKKDKQDILENAFLIADAVNNNTFLDSNRLFNNLVNDLKYSNKITGAKLIEKLTGYNEDYIKKNINLPEFRNEIKKKIESKINELKKDGFIDKDGQLTDKAIQIAAISLVNEEVDKIINTEGKYTNRKKSTTGYVMDFSSKKPLRYSDIALKKTIKLAIKRQHKSIEKEDLRSKVRESKGSINIVFAVDSSGSMKGDKINEAKKAGVALIYKALKDNNKVGLLVFRNQIVSKVEVGKNFEEFVKELVKARPRQQTDISLAIREASKMLSNLKGDKWIIIITDVIPTKGDSPIEEMMNEVYKASENNIRISIVGINLDEKGRELAQKIVEATKGKLYAVKNVKNMDRIILAEYDRIIT